MESKRADQVKAGDAIIVGGARRVVTEVREHPRGVELVLEPMVRKAGHTVRKVDATVQCDAPAPQQAAPTRRGASGPRYTEEQINAAAKLRREQGLSWVKIAAEVGVKADGHFSRVVRATHADLRSA